MKKLYNTYFPFFCFYTDGNLYTSLNIRKNEDLKVQCFQSFWVSKHPSEVNYSIMHDIVKYLLKY